jgi:hypothetical protein
MFLRKFRVCHWMISQYQPDHWMFELDMSAIEIIFLGYIRAITVKTVRYLCRYLVCSLFFFLKIPILPLPFGWSGWPRLCRPRPLASRSRSPHLVVSLLAYEESVVLEPYQRRRQILSERRASVSQAAGGLIAGAAWAVHRRWRRQRSAAPAATAGVVGLDVMQILGGCAWI